MKIGLLECDHVLEKHQPVAGDYRHMFPALLPGLDLVLFDICRGHFPASVDDCDAYICTGSRHSVYEDIPWINRLKAFVRELHDVQKPFIGICFGHQMLAEALGGKVRKAEVGWCVGVHSFNVLRTESWMQPGLSGFNLLMLCQDQVQELPENGTVLACTADCPVGMFRVGETMLGIQAHPEFPKEYLQAVLPDRLDRVGVEKTEAGIASLEKALHREEVAEWVRRFLKEVS